jgi:hypothetical protein
MTVGTRATRAMIARTLAQIAILRSLPIGGVPAARETDRGVRTAGDREAEGSPPNDST